MRELALDALLTMSWVVLGYTLLLDLVMLALVLAGARRVSASRRWDGSEGHEEIFASPLTPGVSVLIPAHDEAGCIAATIASFRAQSHAPERIIVVADNCTDDTVPIARAAWVEVVETVGNTKKKAGALNQVLSVVLPEQGDNDTVMIMDADTTLDQGFLAAAVRRLTDDRALMAVGGLFYGEDGAGLIGQFQRNEYIRYARELNRRRGRLFVLTGTASLFRPRALSTVAASRGRSLPGRPGDVYYTVALTEDNELTLALSRWVR